MWENVYYFKMSHRFSCIDFNSFRVIPLQCLGVNPLLMQQHNSNIENSIPHNQISQ